MKKAREKQKKFYIYAKKISPQEDRPVYCGEIINLMMRRNLNTFYFNSVKCRDSASQASFGTRYSVTSPLLLKPRGR